MLTLVGVLSVAGGARAAEAEASTSGWRIKGEFNLAPAFAAQIATLEPNPSNSTPAETFSAPMALVLPTLGVNLGHVSTKQVRWGARLALQLGPVLAGGREIPGVEYNAQGRIVLGPTVGWQLSGSSPLELEFGLGLAVQAMGGGQQGEVTPNQIAQPQFGVDALGRVIWRPWGEQALFAFQGGLDLGWAVAPSSGGGSHGFLVAPEFGIVVGL